MHVDRFNCGLSEPVMLCRISILCPKAELGILSLRFVENASYFFSLVIQVKDLNDIQGGHPVGILPHYKIKILYFLDFFHSLAGPATYTQVQHILKYVDSHLPT